MTSALRRLLVTIFLPMKLDSPLLALATLCAVHGFNPTRPVRSRVSTRLFNADQEKLLRQEIADRNAQVDAEGKYAIADGENFSKIDAPRGPPEEKMNVLADMEVSVEDDAKAVTDKKSLVAQMERMMKPRAFPLFMAEKAVELVEESVNDLFKAFRQSSTEINGFSRKEKVVILGSGWGAVSFLKEVNTDLYDVTVISPRNHFTFTPMLVRCRQRNFGVFSILCKLSSNFYLLLNAGRCQCRYSRVSIDHRTHPRSKPQSAVSGGICQRD